MRPCCCNSQQLPCPDTIECANLGKDKNVPQWARANPAKRDRYGHRQGRRHLRREGIRSRASAESFAAAFLLLLCIRAPLWTGRGQIRQSVRTWRGARNLTYLVREPKPWAVACVPVLRRLASPCLLLAWPGLANLCVHHCSSSSSPPGGIG